MEGGQTNVVIIALRDCVARSQSPFLTGSCQTPLPDGRGSMRESLADVEKRGTGTSQQCLSSTILPSARSLVALFQRAPAPIKAKRRATSASSVNSREMWGFENRNF